jgi:outer membrane protein assembly factor BamD (BamD/ComL family)
MRRLTILAALAIAPLAHAQTSYQLDSKEGWTARPDAAPDPERARLEQARRMIADEKFKEARDLLSDWIDEHVTTDSALLPEAYFLRGNAKLGMGKEYKALFDYEKIATKYNDSKFFGPALERELDVAILYLNGLLKPSLGIRWESGVPIAEEIILRIHERLPFSNLDQRGEIELADFYYRDRDLKMAATAYDCFLVNFPKSPLREHAMQRRCFATIAQFKGPNYDASGLVEAKYQVQEYQQQFPIQSQQNGMGDSLQARLDESTAAQMMNVAQWYLRHGDPPSARLTLRRLIAQHPATASAQEAFAILQKRGWIDESGAEPKPVKPGFDATHREGP